MQHKHVTRPQALRSQLTRQRWSRWGISLIAVIAMLGALIIWGCSDDGDGDVEPIAVDDAATTREDRARTINVLANDTIGVDDDDDDDVTVTITTVPTNGTATVNANNSVRYRPNDNFNGQDTFIYTLDTRGGTDTATVTVTVVSDAVPATGPELSNRTFVFDDGSVFGIVPAVGATALTFGQFVGGTAPFVLATILGDRVALGMATLASCDLRVASSDFIGVQAPQAGDRITLDPCLVDVLDDRELTVTNADNVTATSERPIPSLRIILPVALDGDQENPPVETAATGTGILTVNAAEDTINFALTYQGIASNVTVAHIHAGARGVNGSPIFFFCADVPEDGVEVDPCPGATNAPVTLSGTLTRADFIPTDNPFPVPTFARAIAAIRTGNTYFNVHSADFPGGEIRGQVENPPAPE